MSNNKDENNKNYPEGCYHCGHKDVLLTEEKNAVPRCAGCGSPVSKK